ncbi:alkaline phosphatase family protein [Nocardia sp. NPDC056000]|uniref:alkaline phosphatase family protein n=1 Tax=Nocardia sp. NPDC056000 TaxID=3345674 RepID=UPI0035D64C23
MDRRNFILGAMRTAGAAGALSLLPASLTKALAEPAPAGGLENVEHVVILMQENRSFDHYFGGFAGVRGYADLNALQLSSGRTVFHQPQGSGFVLPFTTDLENLAGTDHMPSSGHRAYAQGRYDNWIGAKGPDTMARYDRESLRFYHQLADAFTICDRYHCSVNGPTDPNRMYLFTGVVRNPFALENFTSELQARLYGSAETIRWMRSLPVPQVLDALAAVLSGVTNAVPRAVLDALAGWLTEVTGSGIPVPMFSHEALRTPDASNLLRDILFGLPWTTYAERLQQRGVSWQVYQEWDNYGDNSLEYFTAFRTAARAALKYTDAGGGTAFENFPFFYDALRQQPDRRAALEDALRRGIDELSEADQQLVRRGLLRVPEGTVAERLRTDVATGKLPKVSWIVLPYKLSEHPSMGPRNGQAIVHDVLDAIVSTREVWNKTVFILNYDENDGYFDHVPGPVPPPGTADEYFGAANIGLGSRVPLLVVSPWSKHATSSQLFDHTSVLRFLEQVTGVEEPNISSWRRMMCGDLTSVLDFGESGPAVLPVARAQASQPENGVSQQVPAEQRLPEQASGYRIRRPLPYRQLAVARQNPQAGTITVVLSNDGTEAAHFAVHPNAFTADAAPELFDVGAGDTVVRDFAAPARCYDYTVYGEDGFQRRYAGHLSRRGVSLEVTATITAADTRRITLTCANGGPSAAVFLLCANAYREDGPWSIEVPAGGSVDQDFALDTDAAVAGWYDFTVTSSSDVGFLRRIRGYAENGRPGVTADDAAPFDRLLMDRSMYEPGRDPVVRYCTKNVVGQHRLAMYAGAPGAAGAVPASSPVRVVVLSEGRTRDELTIPVGIATGWDATGSSSGPDTGSAVGSSALGSSSGSAAGIGNAPVPSGEYVLYHLDESNSPLAQPVRFLVL